MTVETGVDELQITDERVQFDGASVRRRTLSWADGRKAVVVEPPSRAMAIGDRVVGMDADCGYGRVLSVDEVRGGMALFTSALGAEFASRVAPGARVLPERIIASVRRGRAKWSPLDVTDEALALNYRQFQSLVDGSGKSLADRIPALSRYQEVEIAAAASFYFGRLPEAAEGGLTPSRAISQADLMQARAEILRIAREAELQPDLAIEIEGPEMEMEMAPSM